MNKPPHPHAVSPRFPYNPQPVNPGGMRKINVNVGPPLKRTIDSIVWWDEERAYGRWQRLRKAVNKHKRQHRKFKRRQKQLKRHEYMVWLEQQRW